MLVVCTILNYEIRDNSAAATADRLPYEVWDMEFPGRNSPVLMATFSDSLMAREWINFIAGPDETEPDFDDPMDGDHESGLASAGWGTDEDYGYYGENDDY
jgi:hypothetical protein